jgi:dienelactone hydrolase
MRTMRVFGCVLLLIVSATQLEAQVPAGTDLELKAREFIELIFAKKTDAIAPLVDETMNKAMPPDKLVQLVGQIERQMGAFEGIEGTRREDAASYRIVFVTTKYERAKLDWRVVYNEAGLVGGLFAQPAGEWKSPPYADSSKFREEDTVVGEGDSKLPGTLALPLGVENPPVVVFVHGSGPNDRDETLGPNKVFRDVAWGLATKGIASLRYDKRTLVHGMKIDASSFTPREEVIEDALAAIKLVAGDKRFDFARIVLVGHSLGGLLAPQIASESPELDGAVIMAGSNRPLMELLVEQLNYIFNEDGKVSADEAKMIADVERAIKKVEAGERVDASMLGGMGKGYLDALNAYQPLEIVQKLKIPVLVAQGGRDYQVRADKDFENWKTALEGNPNVSFKLYPSLDHLFMHGEGPSYPSQYMQPRNVSEEYVSDLAAWILALKGGD